MKKIKITEKQFNELTEGFAFEPYYVKNSDGNTIKRQKNVISPKF